MRSTEDILNRMEELNFPKTHQNYHIILKICKKLIEEIPNKIYLFGFIDDSLIEFDDYKDRSDTSINIVTGKHIEIFHHDRNDKKNALIEIDIEDGVTDHIVDMAIKIALM